MMEDDEIEIDKTLFKAMRRIVCQTDPLQEEIMELMGDYVEAQSYISDNIYVPPQDHERLLPLFPQRRLDSSYRGTGPRPGVIQSRVKVVPLQLLRPKQIPHHHPRPPRPPPTITTTPSTPPPPCTTITTTTPSTPPPPPCTTITTTTPSTPPPPSAPIPSIPSSSGVGTDNSPDTPTRRLSSANDNTHARKQALEDCSMSGSNSEVTPSPETATIQHPSGVHDTSPKSESYPTPMETNLDNDEVLESEQIEKEVSPSIQSLIDEDQTINIDEIINELTLPPLISPIYSPGESSTSVELALEEMITHVSPLSPISKSERQEFTALGNENQNSPTARETCNTASNISFNPVQDILGDISSSSDEENTTEESTALPMIESNLSKSADIDTMENASLIDKNKSGKLDDPKPEEIPSSKPGITETEIAGLKSNNVGLEPEIAKMSRPILPKNLFESLKTDAKTEDGPFFQRSVIKTIQGDSDEEFRIAQAPKGFTDPSVKEEIPSSEPEIAGLKPNIAGSEPRITKPKPKKRDSKGIALCKRQIKMSRPILDEDAYESLKNRAKTADGPCFKKAKIKTIQENSVVGFRKAHIPKGITDPSVKGEIPRSEPEIAGSKSNIASSEPKMIKPKQKKMDSIGMAILKQQSKMSRPILAKNLQESFKIDAKTPDGPCSERPIVKTIQVNSDKGSRIAHTPKVSADPFVKQPISSSPSDKGSRIAHTPKGFTDPSVKQPISSSSDKGSRIAHTPKGYTDPFVKQPISSSPSDKGSRIAHTPKGFTDPSVKQPISSSSDKGSRIAHTPKVSADPLVKQPISSSPSDKGSRIAHTPKGFIDSSVKEDIPSSEPEIDGSKSNVASSEPEITKPKQSKMDSTGTALCKKQSKMSGPILPKNLQESFKTNTKTAKRPIIKTNQENLDKGIRIAHTPKGFTDPSVKQPVSSSSSPSDALISQRPQYKMKIAPPSASQIISRPKIVGQNKQLTTSSNVLQMKDNRIPPNIQSMKPDSPKTRALIALSYSRQKQQQKLQLQQQKQKQVVATNENPVTVLSGNLTKGVCIQNTSDSHVQPLVPVSTAQVKSSPKDVIVPDKIDSLPTEIQPLMNALTTVPKSNLPYIPSISNGLDSSTNELQSYAIPPYKRSPSFKSLQTNRPVNFLESPLYSSVKICEFSNEHDIGWRAPEERKEIDKKKLLKLVVSPYKITASNSPKTVPPSPKLKGKSLQIKLNLKLMNENCRNHLQSQITKRRKKKTLKTKKLLIKLETKLLSSVPTHSSNLDRGGAAPSSKSLCTSSLLRDPQLSPQELMEVESDIKKLLQENSKSCYSRAKYLKDQAKIMKKEAQMFLHLLAGNWFVLCSYQMEKEGRSPKSLRKHLNEVVLFLDGIGCFEDVRMEALRSLLRSVVCQKCYELSSEMRSKLQRELDVEYKSIWGVSFYASESTFRKSLDQHQKRHATKETLPKSMPVSYQFLQLNREYQTLIELLTKSQKFLFQAKELMHEKFTFFSLIKPRLQNLNFFPEIPLIVDFVKTCTELLLPKELGFVIAAQSR